MAALRLPHFLCCIYCGKPAIRAACRAHRDLVKLDRPYTPRGILYQPSARRRPPRHRRLP